ncbi:MAG: phosphotransferase family protein [Rhodobacteraceae bacterium]|nr:phosphotransferase family protein [Paracoccaceae bacterium]
MDFKRITEYLEAEVEGFEGSVEAAKTPSGQSNPTYILTTPSGKYVLRSKPAGKLLKSAHAVDREFRVLRALHAEGLPVPEVFVLCDDRAVSETMFYLMAFSEGENYGDPRLPDSMPEGRRAVYDQMNKGLAAVHSVDLAKAGLLDYGPPGSYFERQLSRWSKQYEASATEAIPAMGALISWLGSHMPPDDGTVTLVHGDWRIDNLLFDKKTNALTAILDWELSTLGHPLADLGAQLMQWQMPVGAEGRGLAGVDRAALGIPSDEAYVAAYATRMNIPVPDMRFYVAFSFFRMAAILQGVKRRALDGNASNPQKALELGAYVGLFAEAGLARAKA